MFQRADSPRSDYERPQTQAAHHHPISNCQRTTASATNLLRSPCRFAHSSRHSPCAVAVRKDMKRLAFDANGTRSVPTTSSVARSKPSAFPKDSPIFEFHFRRRSVSLCPLWFTSVSYPFPKGLDSGGRRNPDKEPLLPLLTPAQIPSSVRPRHRLDQLLT